MKALGILFLILLVAIAIAVAIIEVRGVSTRVEPTATEAILALAARHFATPRAERAARNPIVLTDAVLVEGRAHWADHCATCHANDGSGNTEMGRNLYPRAPDMRDAKTQSLTDGELFSIIRNGVRLTGMPAWGAANGADDAETWKLVHFIRHLPKITPAELKAMEALNPVSPSERAEEEHEQEFLEGHR